MWDDTRNEWRRGENYTRNEWRRCTFFSWFNRSGLPVSFSEQLNFSNFSNPAYKVKILKNECKIKSTEFDSSALKIYTRLECIIHIFSTRFECSFYSGTSPGPAVKIFKKILKNVFFKFKTSFEKSDGLKILENDNKTGENWLTIFWKNTLETSGEDWKIHSKRAEKIEKYTRNERGRSR